MKISRSLRSMYSIGFLLSVQTALLSYSNSSFLNQYFKEQYTGLIYSAAALLTMIALILLPKIISRIGSRKNMIGMGLMIIGMCIINAIAPHPAAVAVAFCLLFATNTAFFLASDIVIDQIAEPETMGHTRGHYLTAVNLGYVFAPAISGFVLSRMGFSALFTVAGMAIVPVLIFVFHTPNFQNTHASKVHIWKSLVALWRHPDLRNIVVANFILQFFYAWMVIYTPIYLHKDLGIPWDAIGNIFSLMLFAFILTQIPFGNLADKYLGEKKLLILGFLTMGFSTMAMFFLPFITLPLLAFVLFCTRVGASCVEVMTESYFFKKVSKDETGAMSIFRNAYPAAYLVAPVLAAPIVAFAPTQWLFLILGIICILGVFFIIPIRDTK